MNMIPPQDETRLRAAASGVLPNGKPVVVNTDGTVAVVGPISVPDSAGTPVVFENAAVGKTSAAYDANAEKVVIAYRDDGNSYYGTVVVGTVSGTSISFGSPVLFASAFVDFVSAIYDANAQKVVIVYEDLDNGSYGTAVVGTVSGTSISFGSAVVFESATCDYISATYDASAQKAVIAYRDDGNSNYGTAIVGTVSGTNISFGSAVVFESATIYNTSATYDVNAQRVVIAYRDNGNSNYGTAIVGTVSGTNISFGSAVVFESATTVEISSIYDANAQKVVIAYRDSGNSNYGTAIVGTVSGTSISFGSAVVFASAAISETSTAYYTANNKIVIVYSESGGKAIVGTVSGTSISFDSAVVLKLVTCRIGHPFMILTLKKVVIAYKHNNNSNYGTAVIFQVASTSNNLTSENYIGMSGGGVDYISATKGSAATYESAATNYNAAGYDSNTNRVVFAYKDEGNSNYGTAIVATISGTSISFGTAVVFESATTDHTKVAFDSNLNKIVICYRDSGNSNYGTAIVGTVASGDNSISFGSAAVFNALSTEHIAPVFDTNSNKIVISFGEVNSGTYKARSVVATISGTSISFGGASEFLSGSVSGLKSTFDSNSNKVVVTYISSTTGKARIGTVSGTSISWGTEVEFEDSETRNTTCTFDSLNNKIGVFFYGPSSASFIVGTVSGTDISFGDAVSLSGVPSQFFESIFDTETNLCVAVYSTDPASSAAYVTASISGTTATIGDIVILEVTSSSVGGLTYDSTAKKSVLCYTLPSSGNKYGTAIVFSPEKTDRGEVASGSSASVDVIGTVNEQQTGLTAGQSYYVQTDGTIGLAADSPSVFAGTAISATKLLVKA